MKKNDKISRFIFTLLIFLFSINCIFARQNFFKNSEINDAGKAVFYFEQRETAQKLFSAKKFLEAAAVYEKLAALNPSGGDNWLNLADSFYQIGQYKKAVDAYKRASALGFGFLQYNYYSIAACYARLGEKDAAFDWLRKSFAEQRFERPRNLLADEDFASLKTDARFKKLFGETTAKFKISRNEGWRRDLDFMLSEIKRLNNTYSQKSFPPVFQKAADSLRRRIPQLSDERILVEMMQIVALLGQGHNSVLPWLESKRIKFTQLPVTFYVFPDGLYITDAKDGYENLIGSRVLKFGENDTGKAMRSVGTILRKENDVEVRWLAPHHLALVQVLLGLNLIKSADRVTLTVQNQNGEIKTAQLTPVEAESRRKLFPSPLPDAPAAPLYLKDVSNNFWFEEIPQKKAVYFQFNQVRDKPNETLAAFSQRLGKYLEEHDELHNLIVDLRHNNGGDTYLYTGLLRKIIAFDERAGNKLYVIIGRDTYSAAENFTVELDRLTNAVFVGEPTGGKPVQNGDAAPIVLPFSGLQAEFSSTVWQLTSPRDSRQFVAPDIPVELSAKDYFANRDPVLETILSLIERENRSTN